MTEQEFKLSKRLLLAQAAILALQERVEKLEKSEREKPCLTDCIFYRIVRRLRGVFKKVHER